LIRLRSALAGRACLIDSTAEVLAENKGMQAVFNKSNCKVSTRFTGNVYSYELDFE
jgi:hypothetical protein